MGNDDKAAPEAEVDPRSGFEHEAVRRQLGRILAHEEFHATDKMRDFLRFVVEEKLAGRSRLLKGYTIGVEVFGRSEDFDASNDPIVRIQAGRLRRALERYYLVAGTRDPILIDIPKGGYVPRFAAMSPRPDALGGRSEPGRRADDPAARGASVAVLPFENLSGDPSQLGLTAGLTEELITELSRFQDIAVIPCRPAVRPPGFPSDPLEIARRVGARFMLQGAVRRDPSAMKVSVHLVDTMQGRQIWADASSHPPEAAHLIRTQERIASGVVTAVASEFGIIARRLAAESRRKAPADLRTYEAMLRYYNHQIAPSPESVRECFTALQTASELEPEYGPVWSALATLYCQSYIFDTPGSEKALETALEYAHRGVFLEPGSQLGRLILAYASHLADDSARFQEESEIAISLNPNSPYTLGSVGYIHVFRGERERGLALLERAIAASPCHPAWFRAGEIIDLLARGEHEQALSETLTHRPFRAHWDDAMVAALNGKLGRVDEARPHIEALLHQKPDLPKRVRELLRRSVKDEPLVDDVVDGLRRAGLPIPPDGRQGGAA